jgi:ABC-type bacteriocin/lantibiotic exporter with double-glycine peptidase domain
LITKQKLNISYVPQDTILFDDTIKNNIILDGTFNKERFQAAIKLAKLDDFIESSHLKENTRVGVFGNKISGGQRQRVAFARCFYNPANLIIFDEPFTALDEETKTELKKNVLTYLVDKTIIFITHDTHLMKSFEKIVNLKNF